MLRVFAFMSVVAGLVCAFALYAINYDTRRIESTTFEKSKKIEKARRDIAVLKAERAMLSRPVRIEPFARALGLEPAKSNQFQSISNAAEGVRSSQHSREAVHVQ